MSVEPLKMGMARGIVDTVARLVPKTHIAEQSVFRGGPGRSVYMELLVEGKTGADTTKAVKALRQNLGGFAMEEPRYPTSLISWTHPGVGAIRVAG